MAVDFSQFVTPPVDQRLVPAAFDTLIRTIMQTRERHQQQDEFAARQEQARAEQAQQEAHFNTTERRLSAADAAEAQYRQATLANTQQHQKDEAAAARRDKQVAAAHAVGQSLAAGKMDEIEAMGPYLQALGMEAKVQDADPVMQPMAAFAGDQIPQMNFSLGPRKLVIHADGKPMGDIDLDHLQSLHDQSVEPLLQTLIGGASEQDKDAYAAAADAVRSNPQIAAQGGPEILKTVNEMAGKRIGIEHTDAREQMRVDAATQNAGDARMAQQTREQRQAMNAERQRLNTVNNWAKQAAGQVAQQFGVKNLTAAEQQAGQSLAQIDAALKSNSPIAAGTEAAFSIASTVKALYGSRPSDQEGKQVFERSYGTSAENWVNKAFSGGEISPDQLKGLREALVRSRMTLRSQVSAAADAARQAVWSHPTIQALAPELVEQLGQQQAATILGTRSTGSFQAPPASHMQTPGIPGSAIQSQADELRAQDPNVDAEFQRLLEGGDNANP